MNTNHKESATPTYDETNTIMATNVSETHQRKHSTEAAAARRTTIDTDNRNQSMHLRSKIEKEIISRIHT